MFRAIAQSLVQDFAVAASTWLIGHGLLVHSQAQDFEGSVFFLGMLAFNAFMQRKQTKGMTTP